VVDDRGVSSLVLRSETDGGSTFIRRCGWCGTHGRHVLPEGGRRPVLRAYRAAMAPRVGAGVIRDALLAVTGVRIAMSVPIMVVPVRIRGVRHGARRCCHCSRGR
jgi:hypothetical protein